MTALVLDLQPSSVPHARRFVRDAMAAEGVDAAVAAPAVLLTSEVVTNSVIYGAGDLELRIDVSDEAVRVEVADGGEGCPVREDIPRDADRGRGLNVVARLATRWGVALDTGRTTVWFELRSPRHPSRRERRLLLDAVATQTRRLVRRIPH